MLRSIVPTVYIVVRKPLRWSDEASVRRHIIPEFQPKFDVWNDTLSIPYHAFRHRLTEIARLNLSRVSDVVCARIEDVPPGGIIAPIDDDDWFAPNLAQRIAGLDPSRDLFLWKPYWLDPYRRSWRIRFWLKRKPHTCASNTYAMRNGPQVGPIVESHMTASRLFDANPVRVARLPETLAIHNRTLASQTVLGFRRPTISPRALIGLWRKYRELYRRVTLPAELAWARPYVDMMADLMNELRLR
jgi:hypothetical protein